MSRRRTHRKSRGGCHECKRRRVKCDEVRPKCSNCQKREECCSYPAPSFLEWGKGHPKDNKKSHPSPSSLSEENFFSAFEKLGSAHHATELTTELNMTQLELVAHWCHVAYKSLSRNEETDPVWSQYVMEEAVAWPFLMHGILSLSALHLARLRPDNRATYLSLSVAHQDPGLSSFREQILQITPANAKAMFVFSSIVVAFAFGYSVTASPQDQGLEIHTTSLEELLRVLLLARGVIHISKVASEWIQESNLAPVFNFKHPDVAVPDDVAQALDTLDALNLHCQSDSLTDTREAYQKAIGELRVLSYTVFSGHPTLTLAVGWAIRLSKEVLKDLQTHEPLALVILAHYCVFLHLERGHWCLDGWGAAVMRDIWQSLDDSWKPHVRWAMSKIFESS
ncbi:hypothetical protein HFD88_002184 [Aspergillus terreus]|nr:hypothetical protein HFD88_002184 [Aspergillus terreus]